MSQTQTTYKNESEETRQIARVDVVAYKTFDGEDARGVMECDQTDPLSYSAAKMLGEAIAQEIVNLCDPETIPEQKQGQRLVEFGAKVAKIKVDLETGGRSTLLNPAHISEDENRDAIAAIDGDVVMGETR